MINRKQQQIKYVVGDFIASNVTWFLFNLLRYYFVAFVNFKSLQIYLSSWRVIEGQIFFPVLMMAIYYFSGYYNQPFFKSRLQEFFTSLSSTVICAILIFFIALINDVMPFRKDNYELILGLIGIQFTCIYISRAWITSYATKKIHKRIWQFNTLVIGAGKSAVKFYNELEQMKKSMGYNIVGFVQLPKEKTQTLPRPVYSLENISEIIEEMNIKELIIVPDSYNRQQLHFIINRLYPLDLPIKLRLNDFELISSRVKLTNIYGTPLVDMTSCVASDSYKNIKRGLDILLSCIALVLIAPVMAILSIYIKKDSKGPVFYRQERIGYRHKPFILYKLRTMRQDAETEGPALSSENDTRITRIGHILRKYRFDELPQFWNVLKGDMSIVGPRPEREFFIRKIMEKAPYYTLLYQIRPGITSWGMVKFGYARNIDEMIKRLKFDILYLENMSMLVDMKIIIYTVKTVITGKGI